MKATQSDEPVASPGAATPDESRIILRISPAIESEFKRRGVFPELRRESAARVFNGTTGIHPVSVERAREILADVQAQRGVSGLPRGMAIAYAHLDGQIRASLRQAKPDDPPQDGPGTAEEAQRFQVAASACLPVGERIFCSWFKRIVTITEGYGIHQAVTDDGNINYRLGYAVTLPDSDTIYRVPAYALVRDDGKPTHLRLVA